MYGGIQMTFGFCNIYKVRKPLISEPSAYLFRLSVVVPVDIQLR